jgi:hypothetical protein
MRYLLPAALAVALLVGPGASAQFRDVLTGNCNEDIKYILGWMNGKNGYGGDEGFLIFIVRIEHHSAVVMNAYGQQGFRAAAVCHGLAPVGEVAAPLNLR